MPVKGAYLALTGSGAILLWSGLQGKSWSSVLRNLIAGQNPANAIAANAILQPSTSSGSGAGSVATDSEIANDALHYEGHVYVYGGAPGVNGTHGWDCSSYANWVLGHDLGFTLPGESSPGYSGTSHGPNTISYLGWGGASTIASGGGAGTKTQAGDLCVWQTHMGIAIGNNQMISALNEHLGTQVTTIPEGAPTGELLVVKRINGIGQTNIYPTPSGQSLQGELLG